MVPIAAELGPWTRVANELGGKLTPATGMFGGNRIELARPHANIVLEPFCAGIPSAQSLPAEARIFSRPHEAIVVMPGAVADPSVLLAAAEFVSVVAERVVTATAERARSA